MRSGGPLIRLPEPRELIADKGLNPSVEAADLFKCILPI